MGTSGFYQAPEPQSIVKTKIVAKYFKAWTDIMVHRSREPSGRLAYIDLFSGPGQFEDGKASTPLWILSSAIKSEALCRRLVTVFNDKDPEYVSQLKETIDALAGIDKLRYAPQISNTVIGRDLVAMINRLSMIPSLFFIDPWGYKGLSLDLIGNAIRGWGCDCIFFFNYNRINLAINNPLVDEPMRVLFGDERLKSLRLSIEGMPSRDRQRKIISSITEAVKEVGGRYVLPFGIKSQHGERTSHYIIFVSKHPLGYKIMKDVMAEMSSDDSEVRDFEYEPVKSPQLRLLDLDNPYSIRALKEVLAFSCAGLTLAVDDVFENHTVDTPYLLRHVKKALIELEAEGRVTVDVPAEKRRKGTLAGNKIVTFPA